MKQLFALVLALMAVLPSTAFAIGRDTGPETEIPAYASWCDGKSIKVEDGTAQGKVIVTCAATERCLESTGYVGSQRAIVARCEEVK